MACNEALRIQAYFDGELDAAASAEIERHLEICSACAKLLASLDAGHADVSPPTADFPKEDYRLAGGRVDYIDGHRAAVLVYRHGAHTINVFTWAQSGVALPDIVTRNGYHAVFWRNGDLVFCAVSD